MLIKKRSLFNRLFSVIALICSSCSIYQSLTWYHPRKLDPSPDISLSGKTIMLDPGHGNSTSGSIGKRGSKESDINLIVAKIVKNLLENDGATVYLTRESDTTALWPKTCTPRLDLQMRCEFRDSIQPDLFISLHHNGTDDGNRKENSSKIFYALNDHGASLDVANAINKEFTELLGLGQGVTLGGNFFILRNTSVPSILAEPSFLSNPVMERRLQDSEALHLEAMAYYRGIVQWFTKGAPVITALSVDSARNTVIVAVNSVVSIDPLLTELFLDSQRLYGTLKENQYTASLPELLSNGNHQVRCIIGNANGNYSKMVSGSFSVDRKANVLIPVYDAFPEKCIIRVSIAALDRYGMSVKDSTEIILNHSTVAYVKNGQCYFYIPVLSQPQLWKFACGEVETTVNISPDTNKRSFCQGFVSSSNSKVPFLSGTIHVNNSFYSVDRNGFFSLSIDSSNSECIVICRGRGFLESTVTLYKDKVNMVMMSPCNDGALFGKMIILDPEFGGDETGGTNSYGLRASDINRKIASVAAAILRESGAEVYLARDHDRTIHQSERVIAADHYTADLYVVIRSENSGKKPYIGYYPGSKSGKKCAELLGKAWIDCSGDSAAVIEKPSFVMQQTACPAVTLSLFPLHTVHIVDTTITRKIASTIVDGLTAFYLDK